MEVAAKTLALLETLSSGQQSSCQVTRPASSAHSSLMKAGSHALSPTECRLPSSPRTEEQARPVSLCGILGMARSWCQNHPDIIRVGRSPVLPQGGTAREARFWKSLGQLKVWIRLHFLSAYCAPCPVQPSHASLRAWSGLRGSRTQPGRAWCWSTRRVYGRHTVG